MRHFPSTVVALVGMSLALTLACERNGVMSAPGMASSPTSPSAVNASGPLDTSAAAGGVTASATLPDRMVTMQDACDPETFNAVLGPGSCVRSGGVEFATFLEQLGKHGFVGGWMFAPSQTAARVGQVFVAVNRGGEVHTFTKVDEFGGGFVPDLNALSGNPVMAPECGQLGDITFVPPGGRYEEEPLEEPGVARFQCCIHPWMRLEARVMQK